MAEQRSKMNARAAVSKLTNGVATLVRAAATVAAVILVAKIVLTLGDANPTNAIVQRVSDLADQLALGFKDLFTPASPKTRVLVNYGLAAVLWLVAGGLVARLIRRVG